MACQLLSLQGRQEVGAGKAPTSVGRDAWLCWFQVHRPCSCSPPACSLTPPAAHTPGPLLHLSSLLTPNVLHSRLTSTLPLLSAPHSQLAGTFDLVILPNTMQYVRDPFLSVKILYDLLAPGGYLILTSPFIQVIGRVRGDSCWGMRLQQWGRGRDQGMGGSPRGGEGEGRRAAASYGRHSDCLRR